MGVLCLATWCVHSTTQYFRFQSVVHFNMNSCAEQDTHTCVPFMFTVIETYEYTAARVWKYTLIGRVVTEDSRRIPHIEVRLVLIFLIRYLYFVFVTLVQRTGTNSVFLFRSCSNPVPHRGERVKQRAMQARN
jgi:hypothetical protein